MWAAPFIGRGRGPLACGPRREGACGARTRRSPARAREGEGSDERDPPVGDTGGEGADGPARARDWAGGGRLGRGKEKGKRAGLRSWAENGIFFLFSKPNKQIQFNFKLKEFEFKLNHKHLKQCKVAWMHNNKTISFNFIKPSNHYLFLLNSPWRK